MEGPPVPADALPRLLLSQSTACHWAVDENFELLQVYGNCFPLFHINLEELAGRNILELIAPDCRDQWAHKISAALAGEAGSVWYSVAGQGDGVAACFEVLFFPIHTKRGGTKLRLAGGLGYRHPDHEGLREESVRFLHFLHDQVGQDLSVVGLQLEMLRMDVEAIEPGIGHRASEAQQALERVLGRVRQFSGELRRRLT
jgi:hypothetical protein